MKIDYPEIGVCGLSCRLCPTYQSKSDSRCAGCKSEGRVKVGCPLITCAIKKKGIEFCWQCDDNGHCERWAKHRKQGQHRDSFVCYQQLESNIAFIGRFGVDAFASEQREKERILAVMLAEFNEGRSKSFYCVAATVMTTPELVEAVAQARDESAGQDVKHKSQILHAILEKIAGKKEYTLKLRK